MDLKILRQMLLMQPLSEINLRVAIYTRVSTDSKAQINSLGNQQHYKDFVAKNPTPMPDGTIALDIKIFTGESTRKYLAKLKSRTGQMSNKKTEDSTVESSVILFDCAGGFHACDLFGGITQVCQHLVGVRTDAGRGLGVNGAHGGHFNGTSGHNVHVAVGIVHVLQVVICPCLGILGNVLKVVHGHDGHIVLPCQLQPVGAGHGKEGLPENFVILLRVLSAGGAIAELGVGEKILSADHFVQ